MRHVLAVVLVIACGGHQHGPPRDDDPHHLYVEVAASGSHRGALHDGASAGLQTMSFARPADARGDIELQVEVSRMDTLGSITACSVKILVVRLPQHDLLGIADGSARAHGTDGQAREDCVVAVTTSLVRGKVRTLLRRRLEAKR